MSTLIFSSLYFFLPAAVANMMPLVFRRIPFLGYPISEKWFGKNKTYRGFFFGYLGALVILIGQFYLQKNGIEPFSAILDYENINLFLYALLFSGGALFGDLIKSFFKRRLEIKPGAPFIPFDQIDFILGTYLFLLPVFVTPWPVLVTLLIVMPILHFLSNIAAYFLGIKKIWW